MRILSIFLTLTILIAGVLSCAEPIAEDPVQYNLTVSSSDGGSVLTPGEDTFAYEEGAVVDLVATADSGHYFVEWMGDVDTVASVTAATTTITMEGDYSITASFLEIPATQYNLSISSTAGGSVTTPGEGNFTYDDGTLVSLVASPASGYRFAGWTGDVDTVADIDAASTTITMNGDCSIAATFKAHYTTSNELIAGLSGPAMHTRDGQGQIYFTEFDSVLSEASINRLDPDTLEVVQLIQHQDSEVQSLFLDGQGDVVYVLRYVIGASIAEVRRLPKGEVESQILFSTEGLNQWVVALAGDLSGDVYFSLQSGEFMEFAPGSQLCRIPAGTTMAETLLFLEDSLRISFINVADHPKTLYFISDDAMVHRIYKFDLESSVLHELLDRTADQGGRIAYLATRANGELYYLYRQRSSAADSVQTGYLEIGRFTLDALETGESPEILVADELDRAVLVWFGRAPVFFAVSDAGDVFFNIVLDKGGPVEQAQVGVFWLDPLTGTYVSLVEGTPEEVYTFTFVLDKEMNVLYAGYYTDTIVRINR